LSKTTHLVFGKNKLNINNRPDLNIVLDGISISSATFTKFMGITIDSQLNWKIHKNKLVVKLSRNSAVISKIPYKIDAAIALKLYDTMILTHLSYHANIWAAGSNTSKLAKIYRIQKRTLRSVVRANYRAPSKPIFHKLKRLTIFDIYKSQVGSFMFANLHGQTPKYSFQSIPN